jgi:hypothetical protein
MNSKFASKKRIRFLVMPGFQFKFMGYIISFAIFGVIVLYASNYLYFERLVAEGQELGLAADHIYFEFIEQQKSMLTTTFLLVSVVVFGGLIMAGLALSHKIAGPVYRIQSHLEYIRANGEAPGELKFRDRDFFPEVAELVNELVKHYEQQRD